MKLPQPPSTFDELVKVVQKLQRMVCNQPRLHRKDLLMRYGISESTLKRLLRRGRIPRPIPFHGHLWRLEDLEAAEIGGQLPRPVSG